MVYYIHEIPSSKSQTTGHWCLLAGSNGFLDISNLIKIHWKFKFGFNLRSNTCIYLDYVL